MRSLAFTGVGMGLGCGTAYLVGASQQNIYLSGIVVAAIIVFGLMGKNTSRAARGFWRLSLLPVIPAGYQQASKPGNRFPMRCCEKGRCSKF
jgi:hypothetical protein